MSHLVRRLSGVSHTCRSTLSLWHGQRLFTTSHPNLNIKQTVRLRAKRSRNSLPFDAYIMLIVPVAAVSLGTWQVQRRKWKLNLIDELDRKTRALPVPLPMERDEVEKLEYCRVSVQGEFDHSRELVISPRSRVTDSHGGGGLITAGVQSNIGCNVITAFKLADRDVTILVNRGWMPRNMQNKERRLEGQVAGEVELVGVVRKTEKRAQFAVKDDPSRKQFHRRDIEAFAEILDTEPIFIDADKDSTVPGGPIGGQTRVSLRNEHLSYVFTWYSLAAITSFMWYSRYLKRLI